MKSMIVEWKHLDVDGETCDRCSQTETNLIQEVRLLNSKLNSHGYQIKLVETKLDEASINESNMILINGIPIEKIIDIKVVDNYCKSCSDLVGSDSYCRSVLYQGKRYDEVPREAVRSAVANSLGLRIKKRKS